MERQAARYDVNIAATTVHEPWRPRASGIGATPDGGTAPHGGIGTTPTGGIGTAPDGGIGTTPDGGIEIGIALAGGT